MKEKVAAGENEKSSIKKRKEEEKANSGGAEVNETRMR